jgi:two-component system, NtrC family, response regulator AtoC
MIPHPAILIIDDDDLVVASLMDHLSAKGFPVFKATAGNEGLAVFDQQRPAIVLLDQELPDGKGLDICRRLLEIDPMVKTIFITAYATVRTAVDAMQAGAFNYLTKPFSVDELMISIRMAERSVRLEGQLKVHAYEKAHHNRQQRLVGTSRVMRELRQQIALFAASDAAVLITGETGVGKNVAARAIHDLHKERDTFLTINCAAIPENLMEAEYFGHEKGVFTGAHARREGIFELADGGTLLLDEISEVPYHLQAKLLTTIEEGTVRRVGGRRAIPVDVRIIATSNRSLENAIAEKRFREDLYYRLAVVTLHVPPLRRRLEDIPELATTFMQRFSTKPLKIPSDHLERMNAYPWRGNVRELRNVIERAVLLRSGDRICPADLLFDTPLTACSVGEVAPAPSPRNTDQRLETMIHAHITRVLKTTGGNKTQAARRLGISLSTLKRRIKRFQEIGSK